MSSEPHPRTTWPRPFRPRISARMGYLLHLLMGANGIYRWLATLIERRPRLYRWFTAGEKASKEVLFGCKMCGQCELPATGYTCPMTCPKQLRNGPCGGVASDGRCEVHPELRCVWVIAYERAEASGHGADLDLLQRPVDNREQGRSSWVNYWQGRDDDLWTPFTDLNPNPPLNGLNDPDMPKSPRGLESRNLESQNLESRKSEDSTAEKGMAPR